MNEVFPLRKIIVSIGTLFLVSPVICFTAKGFSYFRTLWPFWIKNISHLICIFKILEILVDLWESVLKPSMLSGATYLILFHCNTWGVLHLVWGYNQMFYRFNSCSVLQPFLGLGFLLCRYQHLQLISFQDTHSLASQQGPLAQIWNRRVLYCIRRKSVWGPKVR